jgi:hypothetical protein
MPASVRKTDIASILESFLDENEEDLSPRMFTDLNDIAGEIDDAAHELHSQIDDLVNENEDLKKQ